MKACIIGGGLTGLVTADALAGECSVDLFEKRSHTGGCLSSYLIGSYAIEQYYHHCFSSDTAFLSLLDSLNLAGTVEWRTASTGSYAGGKIHPLTTPLEILKYPYLTIADKAKLAYLTLRAKSIRAEDLDSVSAEEYIRKNLGNGIYASFFEPLLNSKFGENKKDVSAAWLISRIAIRSDRGAGGERLGYISGGFQKVIDALEASIRRKGGSIRCQEPAAQVRRDGIGWAVNGNRYDTVISTIPPQELARIGGPDAGTVPYQGAACVTLGIGRDVTNGIYWLNMKDPAPYGAVVAHTNFIPQERYGEHIVYLASYFSGSLPQNADRQMISDFCKRFSVLQDEIHWSRMAVDPFAGPVYTLGYRARIPQYTQAGLFMAGMFSQPNYPERSMEGSVRAGRDVVDAVRRSQSRD
jgi:protoporphyrinogen oxidase